MTIPCSVLGAAMPFVGVDPHTALIPPPVPTVVPDITVGALMPDGGSLFAGNRVSGTVKTPAANAIGRGHDTGPFFAHIPTAGLDPLYALVVLGGTSKCQWGVATVLIDDSVGGSPTPLATGVLDLVNIQQQCGDVAPGVGAQVGAAWLVSALNSSVKAGMTPGDYLGGFLATVHDSLVTTVVSVLLGEFIAPLTQLSYVAQALLIDILQWYVIGTPGGYSTEWTEYFQLGKQFGFNDDTWFDWGHVVDQTPRVPEKTGIDVPNLLEGLL